MIQNGDEGKMKIYTARGDQGQTDLLGERVTKSDPRIHLLGELDESTSSIGFARSLATWGNGGDLLLTVQRDLYAVMAELAFTDSTRPDAMLFQADRVDWLEESITTVQESVELPREFVITGETTPGAALDVARTVVRRTERAAVALVQGGTAINPEIIRYLNRLSTLLFILARAEDGHVIIAKQK